MATQKPNPGGLLAEIQAETHTPGTSCAVGRALDQLPPSVAADLQVALEEPDKYPGAAIARAITARGHRLSSGQIQHHRRRGCTCGR